MAKFTERDIAILAGLAGAADFLTEGRFSAPVARALKKHFKRGAVRAPGTLAGVARGVATGVRFVATRHPLIAAGAVVVVAIKHREEIADLVEQGYEILQPAAAPATQFLREQVFTPQNLQRGLESGVISAPAFLDPLRERLTGQKRKKSTFNRAVSAGMKAAKKSKVYGKKGTLSNPKRAFAAVTKIASKLLKGKTVRRTGSSGVIARAMPKISQGGR